MPTVHIRDAAAGVELHLSTGWAGVVGATRAEPLAFLDRLVRLPDIGPVRRIAARTALIADAAHDPPALLIVDDDGQREPGLIAALRGYRGVGLIASPDRGLLDRLTSATLVVSAGEVRLEPRVRAGTRAQVRAAEQAHQAALDAARASTGAHATAGRAPWRGGTARRGRG